MRLVLLLLFVGILDSFGGRDIQVLHLPPAEHMERADLWYLKTSSKPRAVLVLCPGVNGNGAALVRSPEWQKFADSNNLGLVGLSFSSPLEAILNRTGYYYASRGSGEVLLAGIRKIFGRDLPLLLYGISGGAHFTSRFEEWKPDRVLSWCAYSAEWWDNPQKSKFSPPGIVACGEEDSRYGATLIYFKQGRAIGKPWLWVSLANTGHHGSPKLDEFVREYFSTVLNAQGGSEKYVDIDQKTQVEGAFVRDFPSLTACFPDARLFDSWKALNSP